MWSSDDPTAACVDTSGTVPRGMQGQTKLTLISSQFDGTSLQKARSSPPRFYVGRSMARGWGLALVLSVVLVVGAGAAAAAEGGVEEADVSKHGSDGAEVGLQGIASSFRRLCGGESRGGSGGDGEGRREGTAWCEAGPSARVSDHTLFPFSA
jgi:hypothetical protein